MNGQKKEVGRIEASTSGETAYFKIIGRIWSWSADEESTFRREVETAMANGAKKAIVYGSSEGGSVFATYEIANLLDKFGADNVHIEVGSLMASAFTYLTSRFRTIIKSNTQGMIHMPLTSIRGNIKQVKSDLKLLKNITEDYASTYAKKTGKTIDQIKALWNDGDYWMNAKELRKEGFVDAIEGEIEAFTKADVMALVACGAPVIPKEQTTSKSKTKNNHKMDKEELIALYGLDAKASDEDIMEAAKQAKVDAMKHRAADKEATEKETEVTAFVDSLIKDKKVTADKRDSLIKLGKGDMDSLKAMYKDAPSVLQLTKELNPKSTQAEAGREKWTLEDYLEKDPKGYEALKTDNPEKAKHPELDTLNSASKVSMWRLWVDVVAFCIWLHELIVEKNAENSRPHTLRWYREQALSFQDGHQLIWKDGQFGYEASDEATQIIKRCAVNETLTGSLQIKVATLNGNEPQPITDTQLSRFKSYLNQIKDAGNKIEVINREPDLLNIVLEVEVDDQAYNLNDGSLILNSSEKPVEKATYDFLNHLEFNGAFFRTFFKDHLQLVDGVELPLIQSIKWKRAEFPFEEIAERQIPDAGYFKINSLTITYKKYAIQ